LRCGAAIPPRRTRDPRGDCREGRRPVGALQPGAAGRAAGDPKRAIAEYTREIELHANSYKAAFNLGRVYERIGDRRAQIDAYRQAIEMNPSFAEGHLFLAKVYLDTEQLLDEAVRLAHRGIELAPQSEYAPLGHYVIADVFFPPGTPTEAAREAARGRALEKTRR